jgi:DNA-binding NarL/FixJ family response regulator
MSTHKIAVVIHDGDPLFRAGVIEFLQAQPSMVVLEDEFGSPKADHARSVALILVDVLDTPTVIRLQKLVVSMGKRVVLVVGELDESQIEMILEIGARGVVLRNRVTAAELVKAVETASRDEDYSSSSLVAQLPAQVRRSRRTTGDVPKLATVPSERELGVLRLVAEGLGTKEIAERLSYSERTVKGLLYDMMTRKHLRNRAHAVAFAVREGYI